MNGLDYWVLDLLGRNALLLLIAWALLATARRISAAARHFAWVVVFAMVLVMPALVPWAPAWEMPGLPDRAVPRREVQVGYPPPDGAAREPGPSTAAEAPQAGQPEPVLPGRAPSAGGWLFRAWMAGWLITALALARAWIPGGLGGRGVASDAPAAALFGQLTREFGLEGRVRLAESPQVPFPMIRGLFRPVIFLPLGHGRWSRSRLQAVLRHELAHVQRRDLPAQGLCDLACCFNWCNPWIWMAARRMRLERECSCDDRVVASGMPPGDYATELLGVACDLRAQAAPPGAMAMARPSQLRRRVGALLMPGRCRSQVSRMAAFGWLLVFGAGALWVAGCRTAPPPAAGIEGGAFERIASDPELDKVRAASAGLESIPPSSGPLPLPANPALPTAKNNFEPAVGPVAPVEAPPGAVLAAPPPPATPLPDGPGSPAQASRPGEWQSKKFSVQGGAVFHQLQRMNKLPPDLPPSRHPEEITRVLRELAGFPERPGENSLVLNEAMNLIYARGTPAELASLEDLLEVLNGSPPLLMIEARFFDIPLRKGDSWDLDPPLFPGGEPGAFKTAVAGPEAVGRLVASLEKRLGVDMVQAPRVTTVGGRPAELELSEIIHVITGLRGTNVVNGITALEPVVEKLKVGINLRVEATVQPGGSGIHLRAFPRIIEFLGYDPAEERELGSTPPGGTPLRHRIPLPRFRTRTLEAEAVLQPGEALLLAGDEVQNVRRVKDHVPVLGDLPLLGRLFRSESTVRVTRQLLVLITVTEIDPAGSPVRRQ